MENEYYHPVEPSYFKYKAENELLLIPSYDIKDYKHIYICSYTINNEIKYPFLRFLLVNSFVDEKMTFPEVPVYSNIDPIELLNYIKVQLFGIVLFNNNYETFSQETKFKGYFEFNNNLYVFFDITNLSSQINDIYITNRAGLILLDEILNQKHMCDIPINRDVSYFFIVNDNFCFLIDKNDNSYEIPIVSYVGKPESKLSFTFIFGESKNNKDGILGPFYYFTDFSTARNEAISSSYNNNCGVVRFATFTGDTKYFENHQNDIDNSLIKLQRLQSENANIEQLTMRLSDHDGNWAENYDSAYLGCIELDNGMMLDKPLLALREYNQQIPLSWHFISNKNS